jgi:hypothetical protein
MRNVIHESISATELVRNFSAMVDKVRISGKSIYITKGIQTIAELSPPSKSGFPIQNLKNFIIALPSLNEDAQSMLDDVTSIKGNAKLPRNPWD